MWVSVSESVGECTQVRRVLGRTVKGVNESREACE